MIESSATTHKLTRSNLNVFDDELKCQLSIMAIEEVDLPGNASEIEKKKLMEAREDHWAAKLKIKRLLGGLNKRSSRR